MSIPTQMFRARAYLQYWLDAVDEHSLHSPYFYQLYQKVIHSQSQSDQAIENLRQELLNDRRVITLKDLGAGSTIFTGNQRAVCQIARTSLSPVHFSLLYQRLIRFSGSRSILELGTSLGINTLYLAKCLGTDIITFEGDPAIAAIAKQNFERLHISNILLKEGNIDQTLPDTIQSLNAIDMVFFDANHRYEPTLQYFEIVLPKLHKKSILIFDDIYLNKEMKRAWKVIQNHPSISGSVDLFKCGIAFLNADFGNERHVLAFY